MRRRALTWAVPLVALISMIVFFARSTTVVYVLAVACLAYISISLLVLAYRRWPPDSRPLSSFSRAGSQPYGEASRVLAGSFETAITLGRSSGAAFDEHLRPVLYRLAADRLRGRGIDIARQPQEAEEALGTAAYWLICPPSVRPGVDLQGREDATKAGPRAVSLRRKGSRSVSLQEIDNVLSSIERI